MRKRVIAYTPKLLKRCLQVTLAVLFFLQSALLVCLLTYGYIPLPSKWINQQLLVRPFNGLHIQAESFRLKFSREIELINIKVYSHETTKPILEADCATIQYNFNGKDSSGFNLDELVIINGTLSMPAVYAPSGKHTAILERVTLHLKPTRQLIQIDSIAGKHEDIYLRGSIEWPVRPSGKSKIPPIERLYEIAASALKEKDQFSPFIKPTLEFSLSTRLDNSVDVALRLSCETLEYARARGSYFMFNTAFQIRDKSLIAQAPLFLFARKITVPEMNLCAEELTAHVTTDRWPELLKGTHPEFEISAYRLTTNEIELNSPRIRICPGNFPELQFSGSTSGLNGGVAFSGRFDKDRQSGHLFANGSIDLTCLIPETILSTLPQLEFQSNPFYDLSVILDEDLILNCATFRMDVHEVVANDIHFDRILAKGSYGKNGLDLKKIRIDRQNQWCDGAFRFNAQTDDWELVLKGQVLPSEYSPLLPKWWDDIFVDLDFAPETPAYGDFVIRDNISDRDKNFFLGQAKANNFAYKKAPIDSGQLIVRGRRNYVELYRMEAAAGSGRATGNIGFTHASKSETGLLSIRYDFDGSVSPDIPAKILGGTIAETIAAFELTTLPHIKVKGATFNQKYGRYKSNNNLYLEADVQTPLTFKEIPLQHLNFKLYGRENAVFLRNVNFGYANGTANAMIDILDIEDNEDAQICFQLNLREANQLKTVEDLPDFRNTESQPEAPKTDEQQHASYTGVLNLNLHAKGPLDQLYGLTGYGNVEIQNEELGAIQLLGPLSRWLKNTRLNFTSFNLNRVDASFEIDGEQILIDDLEINGPRTCIWANGAYQLPSQAIDMSVRVGLFANAGTPNSAMNAFGKFIASPFPNLLVFNLTGTIYDQKIRSQFDPRNLIPGL